MGLGRNAYNQLGDRQFPGYPGCYRIRLPDNANGIKQMAAGASFSAAVDNSGHLYTWGKLVTDATDAIVHTKPTLCSFFHDNHLQVAQISCINKHAAVITTTHRVFVWGDNRDGQIPTDVPIVHDSKPVEIIIPDNEKAVSVACGGFFTLILTESGLVYGFGRNCDTILYKLEDVEVVNKPSPVYEYTFRSDRVKSIAAGWSHAAALCESGCVYTWGRNNFCRLGHNEKSTGPHLVYFPTGEAIHKVFCGGANTLTISESGCVYVTGLNVHGQNGTPHSGSKQDRFTRGMTKVPSIKKIVALAAGQDQTLFLSKHGSVVVTGSNDSNMIGLGATTQNTQTPQLLATLHDGVAVAAGVTHSLIAVAKARKN